MIKSIGTFLILLSSIIGYSQSKIIGKVSDEDFNETMPFANVLVKGTNKGVTTDFDGNYTIIVSPGKYTLIFSFVGYKTKEITDVEVLENDAKEVNVSLSSSSVGLEEVVISVSNTKNTEEALLKMQKKSANLMDGLSSESFKKVGSSNLANAIKRVPGVSLMGGKYIYVRGLGDRYSKSILNGINIPGLDPDRNTIQMDLFPTNILENVQITKSFSADLPADFTGGLVNIVTKDFTSKKNPSLKIKTGFNPQMHLNSDYLSNSGSSTDFLGFDNGKRALPSETNSSQIIDPRFNLTPQDALKVTEFTKEFNPQMSAIKTKSFMNYSLGYSSGNQFDIGQRNHTIGVIGSISYSNQTEFYQNAENNFFNKNTDINIFTLDTNRTQKGDIGINNIILSSLGGISYRTDHSKYKLNLLHIQNGESKSGKFRQQTRFSDFIDFNKDNLEYTQRSITNLLLQGTHSSQDASLKTEWKLSPTISRIHDKDIRTTTFQDEEGVFSFQENTEPKRIWRFLNENHLNGKIDFTKQYGMDDHKSKIKFGVLTSYQVRNFEIGQYSVSSTYTSLEDWNNYNGVSDSLLAVNNIWSVSSNQGSYINPNTTIFEDARRYNAEKTNFSGYFSNEIKLFGFLRTILGIRAEKFDLYYSGKNSQQGINFLRENVINKLDLFPTANIILQLNEKSNLRGSATRTTARPSFKEASIAEIYDPLSNMTFIGNIELQPSYIQNYDLRYEYFGDFSQMFAFSLFYKNFRDPIEMTYFESAPTNFTPKNLGSASIAGIELEIRKNLSFINNFFKDISLNINASFINSKLSFSESEYNLRQNMLRTGEDLGNYRTLQGQAPFLVNTGLNYSNPDKGIQTGLFYNLQGKTLEIVGTGFLPDVYTMPFHSLNFNFNISTGKEKRTSLNLRINNILNDSMESKFESFNSESLNFRLRNPGRLFSFGYNYKF
tara:strand:+ start:4070 stop:6907 length:2838 start_codon:yes stop_codon:yes gene_type:complete